MLKSMLKATIGCVIRCQPSPLLPRAEIRAVVSRESQLQATHCWFEALVDHWKAGIPEFCEPFSASVTRLSKDRIEEGKCSCLGLWTVKAHHCGHCRTDAQSWFSTGLNKGKNGFIVIYYVLSIFYESFMNLLWVYLKCHFAGIAALSVLATHLDYVLSWWTGCPRWWDKDNEIQQQVQNDLVSVNAELQFVWICLNA